MASLPVDTATIGSPAGGSIPGIPGGPSEIQSFAGGSIPGKAAAIVNQIPAFVYKMRAYDTTLGRTVYWDSNAVDSTGIDYNGPGPLLYVFCTLVRDPNG